jgi:hypothetical protein
MGTVGNRRTVELQRLRTAGSGPPRGEWIAMATEKNDSPLNAAVHVASDEHGDGSLLRCARNHHPTVVPTPAARHRDTAAHVDPKPLERNVVLLPAEADKHRLCDGHAERCICVVRRHDAAPLVRGLLKGQAREQGVVGLEQSATGEEAGGGDGARNRRR